MSARQGPFRILSLISRSWANVPSAAAEVQPNITTSGAVVRMSSVAFGSSLSNIRNSSSRVTSSGKNARCADDRRPSKLLMKIRLHHRVRRRNDQANAAAVDPLERLTQPASCRSIVRVWRRARRPCRGNLCGHGQSNEFELLGSGSYQIQGQFPALARQSLFVVSGRTASPLAAEHAQDGKSLLMDSLWKVHPAEQSLEPRLGPDEVELGSRIQVSEEPSPLLVGFFQGVQRRGLIP
jgi:hypothetical protein